MKRFKRLILVVLAVAALSLLAMPAIGVSAVSNQVEISGYHTTDFTPSPPKITGNNSHFYIDGSSEWFEWVTGEGIVGNGTGNPTGARHWKGDHTSGSPAVMGDDYVIMTTWTTFITCTIAGIECADVVIKTTIINKKGVKTGNATISGDVVGGGSVHGTISITTGAPLQTNYSGTVHFTP